MKKAGKDYKFEMIKNVSKVPSIISNVISRKDSKKFWKILKSFGKFLKFQIFRRLDKNNSAQEIKFSIDQFYDYFKSLNKNEDADIDNQDSDEAIENIDNEDIINILDRGIIPDSWLIGVIQPLFKNKRDINNLDNYRTICHTSNLGNVLQQF
ncbi:unnamed protein product [Mytilus coruscus]|uniref:Uncharacterized protein n=1 Tax=Mytilus coruscus TaxID=42192 RepID=A0A6J8EWB2_MYTCO|nr:unnamed protein product [Mytilus coruscus]